MFEVLENKYLDYQNTVFYYTLKLLGLNAFWDPKRNLEQSLNYKENIHFAYHRLSIEGVT